MAMTPQEARDFIEQADLENMSYAQLKEVRDVLATDKDINVQAWNKLNNAIAKKVYEESKDGVVSLDIIDMGIYDSFKEDEEIKKEVERLREENANTSGEDQNNSVDDNQLSNENSAENGVNSSEEENINPELVESNLEYLQQQLASFSRKTVIDNNYTLKRLAIGIDFQAMNPNDEKGVLQFEEDGTPIIAQDQEKEAYLDSIYETAMAELLLELSSDPNAKTLTLPEIQDRLATKMGMNILSAYAASNLSEKIAREFDLRRPEGQEQVPGTKEYLAYQEEAQEKIANKYSDPVVTVLMFKQSLMEDPLRGDLRAAIGLREDMTEEEVENEVWEFLRDRDECKKLIETNLNYMTQTFDLRQPDPDKGETPGSPEYESYLNEVTETFRNEALGYNPETNELTKLGKVRDQLVADYRKAMAERPLINPMMVMAAHAEQEVALEKLQKSLLKGQSQEISQPVKKVQEQINKLRETGTKVYGKVYGAAVGITRWARNDPGKALEALGTIGTAAGSVLVTAGLVSQPVGWAVAGALVVHNAAKSYIYPVIGKMKALQAEKEINVAKEGQEPQYKAYNELTWQEKWKVAFRRVKAENKDAHGGAANAAIALTTGTIAGIVGLGPLGSRAVTAATIAIGNYALKQRDFNRTKDLYKKTGREDLRVALYGDKKVGWLDGIKEAKGFMGKLGAFMRPLSSKKAQTMTAGFGAAAAALSFGWKMSNGGYDNVQTLQAKTPTNNLGNQIVEPEVPQNPQPIVMEQDSVAQDSVAQDSIVQDSVVSQKVVLPQDSIARDMSHKVVLPQDSVARDMSHKVVLPQDSVVRDTVAAHKVVQPQDSVVAPKQVAEHQSVHENAVDPVNSEADGIPAYKSEMGITKKQYNHMISVRGKENIDNIYMNLTPEKMQTYFPGMTREQVIFKYNKLDEWTIRVKKVKVLDANNHPTGKYKLVPLKDAPRWQMEEEMTIYKKILECNEKITQEEAAKINGILNHIDTRGDTDLSGPRTLNRITRIDKVDCDERSEGYGVGREGAKPKVAKPVNVKEVKAEEVKEVKVEEVKLEQKPEVVELEQVEVKPTLFFGDEKITPYQASSSAATTEYYYKGQLDNSANGEKKLPFFDEGQKRSGNQYFYREGNKMYLYYNNGLEEAKPQLVGRFNKAGELKSAAVEVKEVKTAVPTDTYQATSDQVNGFKEKLDNKDFTKYPNTDLYGYTSGDKSHYFMPTDKGVVEMSVNEKTGKVSSSITTYEKYGQAPNLPEAEQKEMYQQAKEQLRSLRKEGNSSELEEVRKRLEEAKRTYQEGVSTKSSEVVEQKSSVKTTTTINIKQNGGRE